MTELGKYNKLKIVRQVEHGFYLDGENLNDILLPNSSIDDDMAIGDIINVFVYRDSEDRLIATTQKPIAVVGEFAGLKVVSATKVGAFLDWGLPKDLFVPFKEQSSKMIPGKTYVVYIYVDGETDRIAATTRVERYLQKGRPELSDGQEVELLVYKQTPMGYLAIVEGKWKGMLFENEIFQSVMPGMKLTGFVKQVRTDNKIDLILQKGVSKQVTSVTDKILEYLAAHNGRMEITDKSPAETIYINFGVSKRIFKQALGSLYKKRRIQINKDRINLT